MTLIEDPKDINFMRIALGLARRGLGTVAPNPAVGCVIVNNNQIVGRGWTQRGGRPHAETEALKRAGARARGSTVYVTLEPCAHHGVTAPCAAALIEAGVKRVVIAMRDPDPRVNGGGVRMLEQENISVVLGLLEREAGEVNRGFLTKIKSGRPMVTVKIASSLDGSIATRTGHSQWITGEGARNFGHLARATHDAILVGSGTVIQDNPSLTCRLPGLEDCSPIRLVLCGKRILDPGCTLAQTAGQVPSWCFLPSGTGTKVPGSVDALRGVGVEVYEIDGDQKDRLNLHLVLKKLADEGITRVLVEGGSSIISSLLSADLVDRIIWFRAPIIIGSDGTRAVGKLGIDDLAFAKAFTRTSFREIGNDVIECLERRSE